MSAGRRRSVSRRGLPTSRSRCCPGTRGSVRVGRKGCVESGCCACGLCVLTSIFLALPHHLSASRRRAQFVTRPGNLFSFVRSRLRVLYYIRDDRVSLKKVYILIHLLRPGLLCLSRSARFFRGGVKNTATYTCTSTRAIAPPSVIHRSFKSLSANLLPLLFDEPS
ncbi:hypothetical protein BJV78DRAFT_266431 [Lactifluus subvellereus]|nr:hypothetical protein BJV78DRAFT_266431 [Lactifluus subvellereus]